MAITKQGRYHGIPSQREVRLDDATVEALRGGGARRANSPQPDSEVQKAQGGYPAAREALRGIVNEHPLDLAEIYSRAAGDVAARLERLGVAPESDPAYFCRTCKGEAPTAAQEWVIGEHQWTPPGASDALRYATATAALQQRVGGEAAAPRDLSDVGLHEMSHRMDTATAARANPFLVGEEIWTPKHPGDLKELRESSQPDWAIGEQIWTPKQPGDLKGLRDLTEPDARPDTKADALPPAPAGRR